MHFYVFVPSVPNVPMSRTSRVPNVPNRRDSHIRGCRAYCLRRCLSILRDTRDTGLAQAREMYNTRVL